MMRPTPSVQRLVGSIPRISTRIFRPAPVSRCFSNCAPSFNRTPPRAGHRLLSEEAGTHERIICLNGEVDESMSASIVAQLLFLEADNPQKPIHLYINSPGGSVTAGLAIYDTMTYIASPQLISRSTRKEILRVREQLNRIYQRHLTGKKTLSLDEIEKLMERDYFMGAAEALELGIVDEILDRRVKKDGEEKDGEEKKD
ncbi:Clp protease-domain-containing protein [Penicillium hetheringtonii]|uniref:Clp protease-domain-containing protein n=1 Tax=Penicillium hetheringtonii TaxID=911720 RepID=A0AAD6DDQ5_9EURO|nr:Clp protease-domain-containing protein [Penicillium hetheringtonii]